MTGKTWFITGTSRGLGRIWARAALGRGDTVAATARDTDALADLVDTFGDAVLPLTLDVTDRDAVFAAVAGAHERFGRLDVVVNNAGYGLFGALDDTTEAEARACQPPGSANGARTLSNIGKWRTLSVASSNPRTSAVAAIK
jgi:NAD(P)-dependent dehydrogenase (short-subunit alcohol dehydrogenase family)